MHDDKTIARPWHALDTDEVLRMLEIKATAGLSDPEAARRLALHGENRLAEKRPRPAWLKFLDQFKSLLVLILLGAAVLAGAIGDLKDAVVIAIVVLLNATLGFFQEHRAEAALAALKNMLAPTARVRRDGQVHLIDAAHLVPGDILLLEAGDRIPADARVLATHSAEVAEAALTGESHAVAKLPAPVAEQAVLAERPCMVFMNTVVTRGRLEAVVTATGMATEMGRLAGLLAETAEGSTPLQIQLDVLGKRLALIAGAVVSLMFVMGLMRGDELVQTAMTAIALAVAAIPEGLPAVVTVTLALGMHRMAKRHAIVKKLAAVETLGCTTVICSDKTGTLTLNQMTARALYAQGRRRAVSGEGYGAAGEIEAAGDLGPLLLPAALCVDARIRDGALIGDPTEGALLALAAKAGLDADAAAERLPRIAEIPFDSAHKFMATFHHEGDAVLMCVKGAPDVLLAQAGRFLASDGEAPLDDVARAAFERENEALAESAMRVLALASRRIPASRFDPAGDLMPWAEDLTLHGLVGIIDPPRPEARDAIATCHVAGIRVKMITGDHRVTAAAIARELGLTGEAHEGRDLDGLRPPELAALVEKSAVFARVAPEHKLRIVEALKASGHVVAMTGDGVNDAPALKRADIGVAMGITGTEVSKEAAAMVLTDDNFASIEAAVEEGRGVFDNIVKFISWILPTNAGQGLVIIAAILAAQPLPILPVQALWINMTTAVLLGLTLCFEPREAGIMRRPPRRPEAPILNLELVLRIVLVGVMLMIGATVLFHHAIARGLSESEARTIALAVFAVGQSFYLLNMRSLRLSMWQLGLMSNPWIWVGIAAMMGSQLLLTYVPLMNTLFHTAPIAAAEWLPVLAVGLTIYAVIGAEKLLRKTLEARAARG